MEENFHLPLFSGGKILIIIAFIGCLPNFNRQMPGNKQKYDKGKGSIKSKGIALPASAPFSLCGKRFFLLDRPIGEPGREKAVLFASFQGGLDKKGGDFGKFVAQSAENLRNSFTILT